MSKLITRVLGHRVEISINDDDEISSSLDGEDHYNRRNYKATVETSGDHLVWLASDAIAKHYDVYETVVFNRLLAIAPKNTTENTRVADLYLLSWEMAKPDDRA